MIGKELQDILPAVSRATENGALALLSNAVAFLIGLIASRVLHRNTRRAFLAISRHARISVVLPSTSRMLPGTTLTAEGHGVPVLTIGVFKAFSSVMSALDAAGISRDHIGTYLADAFPPDRISDTLFVIGFGKTNEIAALIDKTKGLPLGFVEHAIVDNTSGKNVYEAEIDNGVVLKDYGLMTVIRSPFNPKAKIFLFGGCQSFGVAAAAAEIDLAKIDTTMFGDSRFRKICAGLRRLHLSAVAVMIGRLFRRASDFQIVVQAQVFRDAVVAQQFKERRKLNFAVGK